MTPDRSTEPAQGPAIDDRLDSWKEIASYLKKGVRTVQRWERGEGLPVRRLSPDRRGMVFAYRSEIDAWWTSRGSSLADSDERDAEPRPEPTVEPPRAPSRTRGGWIWAAVAGAALAGAGLAAWGLSEPPAESPAATLLSSAPLTSSTGVEQHPAFSADGQSIAYSSNPEGLMGFDIYARRLQGRDAVRLTHHPAPDFYPAWSPDGRRIAFVRIDHAGSDSGVYVVPASGGAETKIAGMRFDMPFGYLATAAWTKNGDALYISQAATKGRSGLELAILDVSSGASEPFAPHGQTRYDIAPRLSPDGTRLAFLRAFTKTYPTAIVVQPVGPDGRANGDEQVIPVDGETISLDWTPDGKEILYVGRAARNWGLWRVDAGGKGPARLLTGPGLNVTGLAVSAATRRLVYETEQADSNVWRLNVETGVYEEFLASTYSDREAAFSADGERVTFLSSRMGAEQVWVSKADGTDSYPVTAMESGVLASPSWSPDNRRIVFARAVGGQSEIWVANVELRSAERILAEDGTLACPTISRDGRWLFFSSDRDGASRICRMPIEGGEIQPLSSEHGRYAMQSPDGRSLYYATHDGDGLVRRLDLESGQDAAVKPALPMGAGMAAGPEGFYWMPLREPGEPIDIRFRRYDGSGERLLARIPKLIQPGLNLSPDGRWLLYTQMDQFGSDLNIVEDFR